MPPIPTSATTAWFGNCNLFQTASTLSLSSMKCCGICLWRLIADEMSCDISCLLFTPSHLSISASFNSSKRFCRSTSKRLALSDGMSSLSSSKLDESVHYTDSIEVQHQTMHPIIQKVDGDLHNACQGLCWTTDSPTTSVHPLSYTLCGYCSFHFESSLCIWHDCMSLKLWTKRHPMKSHIPTMQHRYDCQGFWCSIWAVLLSPAYNQINQCHFLMALGHLHHNLHIYVPIASPLDNLTRQFADYPRYRGVYSHQTNHTHTFLTHDLAIYIKEQ